MYRSALIAVLIICEFHSNAQSYISEGKNRYTFAQTTFGYDLEYSPNSGTTYYRNSNSELVKSNFGQTLSPTFCITGLHFWGHAEFFTGFSFRTIDLNPQTDNVLYRRSGATGAKYFPWAIQKNKFRPYIGQAISTFAFQQGDGVTYKRVDFPILLGITYSFKRGVLEFGCNYHPQSDYKYYISKGEEVSITIPKVSFSVDFKYFFDLSLNSSRREKNGELEKEFELLKSHKSLSSFSLGVGPAYSFFLGQSSYNLNNKPYLDDHQISKIYPDIGIGYYIFPLDASANISWRSFTSTLSAYEVSQKVHRNSIALECFKFIGDYHGFVPFIGIIASNENFNVVEEEHGLETTNNSYSFFTAGVIAGWDIRSTRTDWWGVRTNIRYFPQMDLSMKQEGSINMQQIELNFLQMILYPNRIVAQMKSKR